MGEILSLAFSFVWGELMWGWGRKGVCVLVESREGLVWKFFNRSPITLKFEAEKLERESQERESESESERESKLLYLRSQVVVVLHS